MKKVYNTDETSLERIWKIKYIKTFYFDSKTPDEIIEMMEEVKEISRDNGYTDVVIFADVEQSYDGHDRGYIGAKAMVLETDAEYKDRLKRMVLVLEKHKKLWEEKSDFYNGTGKDCWSDKMSQYNEAIKKIG